MPSLVKEESRESDITRFLPNPGKKRLNPEALLFIVMPKKTIRLILCRPSTTEPLDVFVEFFSAESYDLAEEKFNELKPYYLSGTLAVYEKTYVSWRIVEHWKKQNE